MTVRRYLLAAGAGLAVGLLLVQPLLQATGMLMAHDPGRGADDGDPSGNILLHPSMLDVEDPGTEPASGPNVLVILTDDQPRGTLHAMPTVREEIVEKGVNFTSGYVTTPVCCPSRSSILTGQYAHNHGVLRNYFNLTGTTFPELLAEQGYLNGFLGKYLNSWNGTPREEFHAWAAFEDPAYEDPVLDVGGRSYDTAGHSTKVLADLAIAFLEEGAHRDHPFFLMWSTRTPHYPAMAPDALRGTFPEEDPTTVPSFNEDPPDKPAWLRNGEPVNPHDQQEFYRKQLATLHALDLQIGRVLHALESAGEAEETLVVFLSDNGYLYGEHGLTAKGEPYEESVGVPFAMRYPPLVDEARTEDRLVANIDIAPTVLDLAGASVPETVDGRSLVPLLDGTAEAWRQELLLEAWVEDYPNWTAVHTGEEVYIEGDGSTPQLYNLSSDPYQLDNLASDPALQDRVAELDARREALRPTGPQAQEG